MEKLTKNNLGQWSIREETITKALTPSTNYSGTHEAKVDGKWYRIKNMGVDKNRPIVSHQGENWYELEGHPEGTVHQGRVEDYNIAEPKAKVDNKWYNVKNIGVDSNRPIVSHSGENWFTLEGHPEGVVHQSRVQDYDLGSNLDKTELNLDTIIEENKSGKTIEEPDFPLTPDEAKAANKLSRPKAVPQKSKLSIVTPELNKKMNELTNALEDLHKAISPGIGVDSSGKHIKSYSPGFTGDAVHKQIGATKSGKPIMSTGQDNYHNSFTPTEHREAFYAHGKIRQSLESLDPSRVNPRLIEHHKQMEALHDQGARVKN